MAQIEPGSQWVLRRGVHSGTVIEVEGKTSAGNIKYRVIKKGDNTGSAREDDDGRMHMKPNDEFLTLYKRALYQRHGHAETQSAFRQRNAPKEKPVAETKLATGRNGTQAEGEVDLAVSLMTVTPELARTWLDREGSKKNRRLVERRVKRLVTAIEEGEWQVTGDPIKLDAEGAVRDGQHRLEAIYRSHTPVQTFVVRNVTEAAFDVIDTGKSRTPSDILAIHGHTNTVAKASAARGLIIIERAGRFMSVGTRSQVVTPTNASILAYVEAHPEIVEAVHLADKVRMQGGFIGGSGLWAIALTMFLRKSPEQTREFVDGLIEGAGLDRGSPILKLRNQYAGNVRFWQSNNEGRERLIATVIKGWNAWRKGESVQQLSWRSEGRNAEPFPIAE